MKDIIVGIDGSDESRKAVTLAARMAQSLGAPLMVANVVCNPAASAPRPVVAAEYTWWFSAQRDWAETLVRETAQRESRPGLSVETRVLEGDPAEALAQLAVDQRARMVVIGHRGRGFAKRLLIGSVADKLVQICDRPVLVSR